MLAIDDGTTISGGTLTIGGSGVLDIAPGTYQSHGPGATLDDVIVSGGGTIDVGLTSAATLTLDGGTSITGGAVVDYGTILVPSGATASMSINTETVESGAYVTANGGTLTISETQPGSENFGTIEVLNDGTMTINHVLTHNSDGTYTAAIAINESGAYFKADGGTLTIYGLEGDVNDGTAEAIDGGTITDYIAINPNFSPGDPGGNYNILEALSAGHYSLVGDVFNAGTGTILASGTDSTFDLSSGAYAAGMTNDGLVEATAGGTVSFQDYEIFNAEGATIEADNGGTVAFADSFVNNDGTIEALGTGDAIKLSFTEIENGTLTTGSNAALDIEPPGGATLDGVSLDNDGTINVDGLLLVDGTSTVSGSGDVVIAHGGYALFAVAFDQNVTFSGDGTLALTQAPGGDVTLTTFGAGDALDLTNIAFPGGSPSFSSNGANTTLTINGETFVFAGDANASDFTLVRDPGGGTEVLYGAEDEWTHTSGGGGAWTTSGDWSDSVPTSTPPVTNAVIDKTGTYTVTVTTSDGVDTANSLTISDASAKVAGAGTLSIGIINNSGTIVASIAGEMLTIESPNPIINSGALTADDGATLKIAGIAIQNNDNIFVDGTLSVDSPTGTLALGGDGSIQLVDGTIIAAGANQTLANFGNFISGDGEIGGGSYALTLDNAAGTIAGNVSGQTLKIDTGNQITNEIHGILVAANGGTLELSDSIDNLGSMTANGGTLDVDNNVTGFGTVSIESGGFADFAGTFNQNVTFSGAGTLALAHSQSYTGAVSGFAAGDAIDLTDLTYVSGDTTVTWANDILTVSAGGQTETITLDGSYTSGDFSALADGAGSNAGTLVVFGNEWTNASGGNWTDDSWTQGTPTSSSDAVIDLAGTYTIDTSGTVTLNSLTIGDSGATLSGSGTLSVPSIDNNGTIEAAAGETLTITGNIIGRGQLDVGSGATLELAGTATNTVTFEGSTGTLKIDSSGTSGPSAPFSVNGGGGTALQPGDIIDLPNIKFDSTPGADSYNPTTDVMTVTDASTGKTVTIDVVGGIGGNTFTFQKDAGTGTEIFDPPATNPGNASVSVGGPGNDNFVFHPGIGADTIVNFNAQADSIELDHFANVQTLQQLESLITANAHGDAVINLGHNDSITLPGTTPAEFHQIIQAGHVLLH
ncbi:MAG TPA: hypothetical protein VK430_12670 [Xanthobacteraceae bacterium]|nr:hypothetical protein [Xanthobacteraceae bacterium]